MGIHVTSCGSKAKSATPAFASLGFGITCLLDLESLNLADSVAVAIVPEDKRPDASRAAEATEGPEIVRRRAGSFPPCNVPDRIILESDAGPIHESGHATRFIPIRYLNGRLMRDSRVFGTITATLMLAAFAGCAVPQPRGDGKYAYLQEPGTKAWYHLYLPVDYINNNGIYPVPGRRLWPLVMTFHGMKPYDNARPQEREWEKEADIYGYIVCAPELHTSNSFMEYPLTKEHDYVLRDKQNVIAIMDQVFATTRADPKAVLSTSWSCGGYLAHYFVNRFPNRFSCLATRLSNFSAALLNESTVPLYRQTPIAIFIGDGDFPACMTESEEAVAWYKARDFSVVRGKMIDDMGHKRIPQTAAAFFAEQLGIKPLRPAEAAATVAQVQMTEYYPPPELIASMSPPTLLASRRSAGSEDLAGSGRAGSPDLGTRLRRKPPVYTAVNAGRSYPFGVKPSFDPNPADTSISVPESRRPAGSAAGSARVARDRRPANWLTPTRNPSAPREPAVASGTADARLGAQSDDRATRTDNRRRSSSGVADRATPLPRFRRSFSPRDAGPHGYPLAALSRQNRPSSDANRAVAAADRQSGNPKAAPPPARSVPAKRVNVKLGGPAIGIAPHYLDYSVDLPRRAMAGADFLWMDNGVWMGDESRGVRILETPGLHRISVLVITKDNQEYRGAATVQVLQRTAQNAPAQRAARR